MRRRRRFLPTEIYFVTIRTVEERFALSPFASFGAWQRGCLGPVDDAERHQMAERGQLCIRETEALTNAIARAERDREFARPSVPHSTFTDSIPNMIGSCLARGVQKFGIQLYGFVWMSNHGHLLIQAPRGNFAEFMAYLNGQIAVNVNRFLGRKHQLWARRYAAAQVLDEAEELERLAYLLANPQNAGIAESIESWAGLSSASYFFQNESQRFLCFDRTAWYKEGRPDDIAPFLSTVELQHSLLPQLLKFNKAQLRSELRRAIQAKLKVPTSSAAINWDGSARRRFLARTVIPTDRPESSLHNPRKRSVQPLCHTTKPLLYRLYQEWYRDFRKAYEISSREYRSGNIRVEFPLGSFAPSNYPKARYPDQPDRSTRLHPTRNNLENAGA